MKTIDGLTLKKFLISASNNLFNHYPEVDALNVFPVPDGDTGINMNLTMTSGANEINGIQENNAFLIAKTFSRGLLMGARGNSGVITSQIFRGFSSVLEGVEEIDMETGIANCGSLETYRQILTVFYEEIETQAEKIDKLYESEDWKGYAIEVHALKSSARIIGAAALGEKAQGLELAAKEKKYSYIHEHHREVMEDYRGFLKLKLV